MWCESNFEIHFSYFFSKPHHQLFSSVIWCLRCRCGDGENIEHGVPGREDFGGQCPAVLLQFRKLSVQRDVGLGEHPPQRFNWLVRLKNVLDEDLLSLSDSDLAMVLLQVMVGMRETDFDPRQIQREQVITDGRFGGLVLILMINRHRVVRLGAHAVVGPALRAEIARKVVVVRSEVEGPANSAGVENERAEIQMAVIDLVVSALDANEDGIGILPGAAHECHLYAMEDGVQRPAILFRAASLGLIPDEVQRIRVPAGLEQLLLLPGVHGLEKSAREPKHFRSRLGAVMSIGVVECLAGWTAEVDTESSGLVKTFGCRKTKIGAQRGIERCQKVDGVTGGVMPIPGPFGPAAVR